MAVVAVFAVFSTCILFPMLLFRSCENNMRLSEEERKQVWEMIEKESIDEKISAVTEYEIRTAGDGVYGKEELTDYTNKYAQEYLGVQSEYTDLTIDTNVLYEDGIVYVAVLADLDGYIFYFYPGQDVLGVLDCVPLAGSKFAIVAKQSSIFFYCTDKSAVLYDYVSHTEIERFDTENGSVKAAEEGVVCCADEKDGSESYRFFRMQNGSILTYEAVGYGTFLYVRDGVAVFKGTHVDVGVDLRTGRVLSQEERVMLERYRPLGTQYYIDDRAETFTLKNQKRQNFELDEAWLKARSATLEEIVSMWSVSSVSVEDAAAMPNGKLCLKIRIRFRPAGLLDEGEFYDLLFAWEGSRLTCAGQLSAGTALQNIKVFY